MAWRVGENGISQKLLLTIKKRKRLGVVLMIQCRTYDTRKYSKVKNSLNIDKPIR